MNSIRSTLRSLSEESVPGAERTVEEGNADGEDWFRVTLFVGSKGASVGYWSRPHVGGLLDFEVVDGENDTQLYWAHLEHPDVAQVITAWRAMILQLLA